MTGFEELVAVALITVVIVLYAVTIRFLIASFVNADKQGGLFVEL